MKIELLKWAKGVKSLAKMGLVLASIALQVCTGLTTPPSDFDAALGTKPGGPLSSKDVEKFRTPGFEAVASLAGKGLESVRLAERLWQAGAHRHGVQQVKQFLGLPVCCPGIQLQINRPNIMPSWVEVKVSCVYGITVTSPFERKARTHAVSRQWLVLHAVSRRRLVLRPKPWAAAPSITVKAALHLFSSPPMLSP